MLLLLFGSFIVFCALRVPIAFALILSCALVIIVDGTIPLTIITQRLWVGLNNFPLLAIPFFLFMGLMMNSTGTSQRLIDFSQSLVGHLKGGLANVNVVVSMIFAGISGSSTAETAGVGSVMIPGMIGAGYSRAFSVCLTAAASTLGNIIPPSIMMIIYASTAGISVGGLFLTGIVPGVLLGVGQMFYSRFVANQERIRTDERFSFPKLLATTKSAVLALVIPIIIIGGIIGGVFTATEASVIAVLYTCFLAWIYKQLSIQKLYGLVNDSMIMFSLALFCAAAASVWGWMLAFYNVPQEITAYCKAAGLLASPYYVFAFVVLIFLVIGTFMDAIPAIIILQPIVGELVAEAGINPYHMGLVVVLTMVIGLITPPYGLCLMIACDIARIPIMKVTHAMIPFYFISLAIVLIAVIFPDLVLFVPRLVMPEYFK